MSQSLELRNALQQLSIASDRRLVLLAADFSVMAYSIHETLEDRARLAHVMTHSDLWKTSGPARYEVEVRTLDALGDVLLIPLIGSDLHLLAVLVFPLEEGEGVDTVDRVKDLDGLGVIRSLLEIENSISETFGPMVSALLADLVSPTEFTRKIAAQELYDRKLIASAKQYTLVLVGVGSGNSTALDGQKVRKAVAFVLRFVNSRSTSQILGGMLSREEGVLIFPRPVQQDQLDRLLVDAEILSVRAGISPLSPISDFYAAYQRAKWALLAGIRLGDIYGPSVTWQQSGINGYIASIPIERLGSDDLPRPIVAILKDRGARRWIDTLRAYVELGGDIPRAARKLHIHRSTVYYRLERFNEITGIDITDKSHHAELLFALRLVAQYPLADELEL